MEEGSGVRREEGGHGPVHEGIWGKDGLDGHKEQEEQGGLQLVYTNDDDYEVGHDDGHLGYNEHYSLPVDDDSRVRDAPVERWCVIGPLCKKS